MAANKAMTPVLKAARYNAKRIKATGHLSKSLGKKVKVYPKQGIVWVAVGPMEGHKQMAVTRPGFWGTPLTRPSDPTKYAHLIELGHVVVVPKTGTILSGTGKNRRVRKSKVGKDNQGKVWKVIPPQPFLRPALEKNRARVIKIYQDELGKNIIKEFRKYKAKVAAKRRAA